MKLYFDVILFELATIFIIYYNNFRRHCSTVARIILRSNLSHSRSKEALRESRLLHCLKFILDSKILQTQKSKGFRSSKECGLSSCLINYEYLTWSHTYVVLDQCDLAKTFNSFWGFNLSSFGNKSVANISCL